MPYKKVDYCCMIGIKFEMRETLEKILKDIREVDPTFKFGIHNSKFPQYDQIIIVSSKTRDQAHKRGLLLCKRYAPEEYSLQYWVKPITHVKTQINL